MSKRIQQQDRIYEYDEANKLGSGSFADVFKGVKIDTQTEVAIKVIKKAALKRYGDDIMTAIGSEVNILQQISSLQYEEQCQFIVKIFDCFATTNHIYIVLEFCNQGNLLDIIKSKKKIPEKEAIQIIYQVVCSIQYLTKRGIAHRDIKPENIFIHNGIYKLGDFGFASQKSLFTTTLGTYPYMAPEFFKEKEYDVSVDIWAIGVMYHEMLFGELYFIGNSHFEVSQKIIEKPYVIQKPHLISPESQDFLMRCIEKNKQHRITADQSVNHQLFASIKNQPQFKQVQKQVITETDLIYDQIVYIRNSALFLIDLVEELQVSYPQDCRFDIYYLIKKSVSQLSELHSSLNQQQVPQYIQASKQGWFDFLAAQQYIKIIDTLYKDKQALFDKFMEYHSYLDKFLQTNFKEQYQYFSCVINLDTTKLIDPILYNQQLYYSYEKLLGNHAQQTGLEHENRNALMLAYQIAVAQRLKQINIDKTFDFIEFEQSKQRLTVYQIKDRLKLLK